MGRMVISSVVLLGISVLLTMACVDVEDAIPRQVESFLSQEDILALESVGMNIYKGSSPPKIEGSYLLTTLDVFYDDLNSKPPDAMAHYTYIFKNQIAGKISVSFSAPATNDSATDLGGYVSGNGDCFNVFVEIKGTDDQCNYTMPSIFTGCLTGNGIIEWQWGFVMGEKVGATCDKMLDQCHKRIFFLEKVSIFAYDN